MLLDEWARGLDESVLDKKKQKITGRPHLDLAILQGK